MDLQAIFAAEPVETVEPVVVAMHVEPDHVLGWSSWIETRPDGDWYVEQRDDAQVVAWEDGVPWD